MQRLTNASQTELACREIRAFFAAQLEWFLVIADREALALNRHEFEIELLHRRLVLSCWTEKGSRSWTINSWQRAGEKLIFDARRRMGAERFLIELVPRASASTITATIRAARQTRGDRLAELAASSLAGARIERSALSPGIRRGQPGRFARILLRLKHQRVAVTASVTSSTPAEVDAFLASALLWFRRTGQRLLPPYIQQLWLVVESASVKTTLQRLALLSDGLRSAISLFEIDSDWTELKVIDVVELNELWKRRLARFPPVEEAPPSQQALELQALAPEAVDIVRTRYGETLRFFGLPFARVRQLLGREQVWFGVDGARRKLLELVSQREWQALLDDLQTYRSAASKDLRHALYRGAAEAWLESILRRDITKLDPGLIIAPLHAQFRTTQRGLLSARPIDLLALRRDGRLVVIELKVTEDREHVFQGADYWQRVEAHRRRGHISRARLFGRRSIRDESPLVYLVAPTLRVHPSLPTLGGMINPAIELYRFDINEDWRSGVRVMRRTRINGILF